jgi:hypothetical protein
MGSCCFCSGSGGFWRISGDLRDGLGGRVGLQIACSIGVFVACAFLANGFLLLFIIDVAAIYSSLSSTRCDHSRL